MSQLIGIYSSVPHSGKSEIGKILIRQLGYVEHPFARPLKEHCIHLIQVVTGMSEKSARKYLYSSKKEQIPGMPPGITGRVLMQKVGTDFGRNMLDRLIWLNAWKREVQTYNKMFFVVADDMRFEEEAGTIRNMGGQLWRVTRPGLPPLETDDHESEGRLEHFDFDVEILNDGTINDLHVSVMNALRVSNATKA